MIGSLPLALIALTTGAHVLAARVLPAPRAAHDRAVATALFVPLGAIAIVLSLGPLHAIAALPVFVATLVLAAGLVAMAGASARALARTDARRALDVVRGVFTGPWALSALVALAAVAAAGFAAWLLAPWAWDALGYHLPLVYDALQERHLRDVPTGVVFVNAYPHAGDWFVVWWRVLLRDDTFVDLSQLPFAVVAVVTVASMAARAGVSSRRALALAGLFAAIPVAMLQLASSYVDITYASVLLVAAYFATSTVTSVDLVLTGVATGLLLSVKPTAPPAAVAIVLATSIRLARTRPRVPVAALVLALLALVVGSEKYLVNLAVHHNPIWPVQMHLGPVTLPGTAEAREYIEQGLPAAYRHRSWLSRLLHSWVAWPDVYVYDMRVGGNGPLFVFALLPLGVLGLASRRARAMALPLLLVAIGSLATPGAFSPRYTLALPGALIAVAAVTTDRFAPRVRTLFDVAFAVLGAWGLSLAMHGFTFDDVSLWRVHAMDAEGRAAATDIDARGRDWLRARALVGPGDAFGADDSMELTGYLWRPDGRGRIAWLTGPAPAPDALRRWTVRERVRVAVLNDEAAGAVARAQPEWFTPLFHCTTGPCTVYRVERTREATGGIVVLAPHPDDEVLIAAGVIRAAVERGETVSVLVVTNGDYTCARDGWLRERESVAALARLGVPERDVHFLGYPDGYLTSLGERASTPVARRNAGGECVPGNTTYAARGAGRIDEHSARTGAPATYSADALRDDLAAVLMRLRPRELYVVHPIDEHPDHAMTYAYLRRALEQTPALLPLTVHRAVVHAGACWPDGSDRREPCPVVSVSLDTPMPPLPAPLAAYVPGERIALPGSMRGNPIRFDVIAVHASQTGPDPAHDWLASFARADEVFYPERLVADASGRTTRAVPPGRVPGSVTVRGDWTGDTDASREIAQTAPLRCAWEVRDAVPGSDATVRVLSTADTGYELTVHDGAEVELARTGPGARVLRRLALPDDGTRARSHTYELRVDPRPDDGDVAEITVRRDGDVLMVAVDLAPLRDGARIGATVHGSARIVPVVCQGEP